MDKKIENGHHLIANNLIAGNPILSSPILYQNIDTYCLVFDLCSSSTIMENLQSTNNLMQWARFWEELTDYLINKSLRGNFFRIYKFVGDGFILFINKNFEGKILDFCKGLYQISYKKISDLVENYCEILPNRMGITIGIEKGKLIEFKIGKDIEFSGKAINIATRLQSSLKEPKQANKLLVSKRVKNSLGLDFDSEKMMKTSRILHNLYGDKRFACFEIDLQEV